VNLDYLEVLKIIHRELTPSNYVEIGCRQGRSLTLARCPSIAIDPEFEIIFPLEAPTRIFKSTSDEFFGRYDLKSLLGGPLDLAFIDGMHKAEFVLRDFINLEKSGDQNSIILIDDVLPQKIEWTTRERLSQMWTGDVYKILMVFKRFRPDLRITVLDVDLKGLAWITGIDSSSTWLLEHYAEIERAILSDEYTLHSEDAIRALAEPVSTDEVHRLLQEQRLKTDRVSTQK
jgi:hypothetical protein